MGRGSAADAHLCSAGRGRGSTLFPPSLWRPLTLTLTLTLTLPLTLTLTLTLTLALTLTLTLTLTLILTGVHGVPLPLR